MILDDPELDGVAAVLFDEFHERSLDADLGLALARDVQQGLREDLKLLVMSATIDGARVAALLGDAPVIESEGRAFPVETRYLGRDPRRRSSAQVADAIAQALRAEAGSVLAFLPGAAEIRRTETHAARARQRSGGRYRRAVRRARCRRAGSRDRAGAAGQRKVVLATSIAETSLTIEGVRVVVDCGLARVPRYEPDVGTDPARDRAGVARRRRPAPRPRRPHRARRLLPAVGRAADRVARAVHASRKFSPPISPRSCSISRTGASPIPAGLAFLDPPPAAALDRGARAAAGTRRDRCGRPHHRRGPGAARACRCRRGSPAWWSTPRARAQARRAAEIAAVLTERGLGGDDVDLDASARQFAPRSLARARGRARAQSASAGRRSARRSGSRLSDASDALDRRAARARLSGSRSPRTAAAAARSCSPTAAAPMSIRRRALSREPLSRGRPRSPAPPRRAASCWPRRSRSPRSRRALPAASRARDEVAFDRAAHACARAAAAALGAIALVRTADAGRADERHGRACLARTESRARARPAAVDEIAAAMARPRDVPAQGRGRRMAGSVRRRARRATRRLARAAARGKTALAQLGATNSTAALHGLLPWDCARRLDAEAPTHFDAPTGSRVPIDYEAEEGPKHRDPRAGTVRPRPPSVDRRRARAAGGRTAVAGAPAGAGHARSAGLLARQLRGGERRDARPLSAPSLAGRSAAAPPTRRAKPRGLDCSRINPSLTLFANIAPPVAAFSSRRSCRHDLMTRRDCRGP